MAKQHIEEHAHVLLAPDHTFANWLEARTLAWEEHLQVSFMSSIVALCILLQHLMPMIVVDGRH